MSEAELENFYKSHLATLIESGAYGIHYLNYQVLTDELEKEI